MPPCLCRSRTCRCGTRPCARASARTAIKVTATEFSMCANSTRFSSPESPVSRAAHRHRLSSPRLRERRSSSLWSRRQNSHPRRSRRCWRCSRSSIDPLVVQTVPLPLVQRVCTLRPLRAGLPYRVLRTPSAAMEHAAAKQVRTCPSLVAESFQRKLSFSIAWSAGFPAATAFGSWRPAPIARTSRSLGVVARSQTHSSHAPIVARNEDIPWLQNWRGPIQKTCICAYAQRDAGKDHFLHIWHRSPVFVDVVAGPDGLQQDAVLHSRDLPGLPLAPA